MDKNGADVCIGGRATCLRSRRQSSVHQCLNATKKKEKERGEVKRMESAKVVQTDGSSVQGLETVVEVHKGQTEGDKERTITSRRTHGGMTTRAER